MINDNKEIITIEEYRICIRDDGKKVRRKVRKKVRVEKGSKIQKASKCGEVETRAKIKATTKATETTTKTTKTKISAKAKSLKIISENSDFVIFEEIVTKQDGKKVRRVIKKKKKRNMDCLAQKTNSKDSKTTLSKLENHASNVNCHPCKDNIELMLPSANPEPSTCAMTIVKPKQPSTTATTNLKPKHQQLKNEFEESKYFKDNNIEKGSDSDAAGDSSTFLEKYKVKDNKIEEISSASNHIAGSVDPKLPSKSTLTTTPPALLTSLTPTKSIVRAPVIEDLTTKEADPTVTTKDDEVFNLARLQELFPTISMNDPIIKSMVELLCNDNAIKQKRVAKLLKQLNEHDIAEAEDLGTYIDMTREKDELFTQLHKLEPHVVNVPKTDQEISINNKYFVLSTKLLKLEEAIKLTDEYKVEQLEKEQKWEDEEGPINQMALRKIRSYMPVDIGNMSRSQLLEIRSPTLDGKYNEKLAKRYIIQRPGKVEKSVMQLIRRDPKEIETMHHLVLEAYQQRNLTLTELRALYAHIKTIGPKWEEKKTNNSSTKRKKDWYDAIKKELKEKIDNAKCHAKKFGPVDSHNGCRLNKRCPFVEDVSAGYDVDDFGFSTEALYQATEVTKCNEDPGGKAREEAATMVNQKKVNDECCAILKMHYNKNIVQRHRASRDVELMGNIMDDMERIQKKWVETFVVNNGENLPLSTSELKTLILHLTKLLKKFKETMSNLMNGTSAANQKCVTKDSDDNDNDPRSSLELSLSEQMYETANIFFTYIKNRLHQIQSLSLSDTYVNQMIQLIQSQLKELHIRNINAIQKQNFGGVIEQNHQRKIKLPLDMEKEYIENLQKKRKEKEVLANGKSVLSKGTEPITIDQQHGRSRAMPGSKKMSMNIGFLAEIQSRGKGLSKITRGKGTITAATNKGNIGSKASNNNNNENPLLAAIRARGAVN